MNVPLFKNFTSELDYNLIKNVIDRKMHWANGPEIKAFENKLAEISNTKYCLSFNSGTSAGHGILHSYGIGKGDEVLVPSFTFIATVNWCVMVGAKPVFVDIEQKTFGMDPKDIENKITSKTKAIMPIHYGGRPCQIEKIKKIAKSHNCILIEDAAEALGSKFKNQPLGTFGDAAIFSFTPTKIISTGEGGAVVTNNRKLYEKLLLFRSHGRLETEDYFSSIESMDYIELGYNFRMPTICAAQGLAQIDNLDIIISKRVGIAKRYKEKLEKIDQLSVPADLQNTINTYQMFPIIINEGVNERDKLKKFLFEKGITTKVYFDPVHKTHFYSEILGYSENLKATQEISEKVLCLPIFPDMTKLEINYVIKSLEEFFD